MAEVTINIESSLAAMAFVIADQQQQIKDLRETVNYWRDQFSKESENFTLERKENISLRDQVNKLEKKNNENINTTAKTINKLKEEKDTISNKAEGLYQKNVELCEQLSIYKDKILKWIPYSEENFKLDADCFTNYPNILVKEEVIKEGPYDAKGNQHSIGDIIINCASTNVVNGEYKLYANSYTRILAWCLIEEKNFLKE